DIPVIAVSVDRDKAGQVRVRIAAQIYLRLDPEELRRQEGAADLSVHIELVGPVAEGACDFGVVRSPTLEGEFPLSRVGCEEGSGIGEQATGGIREINEHRSVP